MHTLGKHIYDHHNTLNSIQNELRQLRLLIPSQSTVDALIKEAVKNSKGDIEDIVREVVQKLMEDYKCTSKDSSKDNSKDNSKVPCTYPCTNNVEVTPEPTSKVNSEVQSEDQSEVPEIVSRDITPEVTSEDVPDLPLPEPVKMSFEFSKDGKEDYSDTLQFTSDVSFEVVNEGELKVNSKGVYLGNSEHMYKFFVDDDGVLKIAYNSDDNVVYSSSFDGSRGFMFGDIKDILRMFVEECRQNLMDYVKERLSVFTNSFTTPLSRGLDTSEEITLPECNISMVTYERSIGKTLKIDSDVNNIELTNGTLSVTRDPMKLRVGDVALNNTIEDIDQLVRVKVEVDNKENLIGSYVEFHDYSEGILTVALKNSPLTSKVMGVLKDVFDDDDEEIVWRHLVRKLEDPGEGYVWGVLSTNSISCVKVNENVTPGMILMPGENGFFTKDYSQDRVSYVLSHCIPRVRVLEVNERGVYGLVLTA